MDSQMFFEQTGVIVGLPGDFNQYTKEQIFNYIERNHYRGMPRQDDGTVNPYQYCYGLGYVIDDYQMFGGMVSGYPAQAFQHYAPHIVEQFGNSWVSKHVANIYRIVAHYPDHANALISQYEQVARRRGIKILYSLPTKEEKDAVCNYGWFERNGFRYYAETKDQHARFYVKKIADIPRLSPTHRFNEGPRRPKVREPTTSGDVS